MLSLDWADGTNLSRALAILCQAYIHNTVLKVEFSNIKLMMVETGKLT